MNEKDKKRIRERRVLTRSLVKDISPINWEVYEKGWTFFQEDQTVSSLSKKLDISLEAASSLIEKGFPEMGMKSYAKRLIDIRKSISEINDQEIAIAMAENNEIIRDIKNSFKQALTNISFNRGEFSNLDLDKALKMGRFMDVLMRLETYTLKSGVEERRVLGKDKESNGGDIQNAVSGLLNSLTKAAKKSEIKEGKSKVEIIDVEFSEESENE